MFAQELAELVADVRAQRPASRTVVDVVEHDAAAGRTPVELADGLVASLGLSALGAGWRAVAHDEARRIACDVLASHRAYGVAILPSEQAAALVDRFLDLIDQPRAYFTNTHPIGSSRTIAPITGATVDEGIVVVGRRRSGILWVADED